MRLRGKPIRAVTPEDIRALVREGVRESYDLEFKSALPSSGNEDKKEFLRDVTAMANAGGGMIVYGIEEVVDEKDDRARAGAIRAVDIADQSLRRLEQIARDNSDPTLPGLLVRGIEDGDDLRVVLLGVPQSLLAPHAEQVGTYGTYWRRSGTMKLPLSTAELRQMFLERGTWEQIADDFRRTRMLLARDGMLIKDLDVDGSVFVHVLPLGRLSQILDVRPVGDALHERLFKESQSVWNRRPNIDGVLCYQEGKVWGGSDVPRCRTYAQVLRNGGIEFYSTGFAYRAHQTGERTFDAARMASWAKRSIRIALELMDDLPSVNAPYAVLIACHDLMDAELSVDGWSHLFGYWTEPKKFDRHEILLPSLVLDEQPEDLKATLFPLFDMLWQAAGFEDCFLRRAGEDW